MGHADLRLAAERKHNSSCQPWDPSSQIRELQNSGIPSISVNSASLKRFTQFTPDFPAFKRYVSGLCRSSRHHSIPHSEPTTNGQATNQANQDLQLAYDDLFRTPYFQAKSERSPRLRPRDDPWLPLQRRPGANFCGSFV